MTFVFSPQRVAQLRERGRTGQVCATLVLPSDPVMGNGDPTRRTVRHCYREFVLHDADGQASGIKREAVKDVDPTDPTRLRPARLTVLMVELVDIYAERATAPLRTIDVGMARGCGFKIIQELKDDWKERHPRSELAKCVWFVMGDARDKDRFLQRYISRGGDYTGLKRDAIDELPALTEEQLRELAANAQQRDLARTAQQATVLSELTLSQRVARIEATGEAMRREIKNELLIITDRTARGVRKLAR